MGTLEPISVRLPWDDHLYEASLWEGRIFFDEQSAKDLAAYWTAHRELFPDLYTEFYEGVFQQYDENGAVIERYLPHDDLPDMGAYYEIGCVSDWEWELCDTEPYDLTEPDWADFTPEAPGWDLDDR